MKAGKHLSTLVPDIRQVHEILEENKILRNEIRVARKAAQITADLVVKQFEETEKVLNQLHMAKEKYLSLFNSGPNPIFVLDTVTLEILDVNPRGEETYGCKKNELIGRKFTDFGSFEFDDKTPAHIEKNGWPEHGSVIQKLTGKKRTRPKYIKIKKSPTSYKGKPAIILAGTDITEVIEKDAQLIQASKMTTLGEMSAGVAHELNQPLNAIKLGNEYIKMMMGRGQTIPEEALQQVATEVCEQVERATDIINRLRAFGRKTDDRKEKVDINLSIIGVLKIIGRQFKLEGIRVLLDLAENSLFIMAQQNRLEQVIFNLLTNARDAVLHSKVPRDMHSGKEQIIKIKTYQDGAQVIIAISDNGIGIPKEIRDKVFEPFFTTKEVGQGMGLGLSIIYGIIKDFGGGIELISEEGRGTSFKLIFKRINTP